MTRLLALLCLVPLAVGAAAPDLALSVPADGQLRPRVQEYLVTNGLDWRETLLSGDLTVITRGDTDFLYWGVDGLAAPAALDDLPTFEQIESNKLARAEAAEIALQASKPLERKELENDFFTLIDTVRTAVGETNSVPSEKLPLPVIQEKLETLQETDVNTAIILSLKLLAVDAALKNRYGLDWWSSAARHDIGE